MHHSRSQTRNGFQMLPHMLSEDAESRWALRDSPVRPGGVVIVCDYPVCWTVSLKHKHHKRLSLWWITGMVNAHRSTLRQVKEGTEHNACVSTYMPEVNGGDKIIWPLFASHCCDLDESMVNCPWVQWPVLVTENLHTKNELISLEQMSSLSM